MPLSASLAAILLYLVPVPVLLACRARRARPLRAVALDIPLAVACDLLLVLTLARFVRLEIASLVSRPIWLAAGLAYLVRRRRAVDRPAGPRAAGVREVAVAALAGAVGTWLSTLASRPYSIWDRKWHTPLVASLRGQTIPFENVFRQGEVLHYHFTGDVHAAMLQSFSLDVIHSSLALSLAHDVMFGLIGVTFALLLAGLGARSATVAVLGTLTALLAGPYTFGRALPTMHVEGYSLLNYYTMSFRPHDALAGLFYLGIVGALAGRVFGPQSRLGDTVPALIGSAAGLAISDEASLGLLGLSLGVTWLVYPRILHSRRAAGAAILVGLLAAFIVPNVAFAASIAPGAQRHTIGLVPWRSPGCGTPSLPLTTAPGLLMLLADLGPSALLCLGAVLVALATRRRRASTLAALATVVFVLSALALTRLDVNHDALESHRFMTLAVFLAPVLSLLVALPRGAPRAGARAMVRARSPRVLRLGYVACAAGVILGAGSTVDWIVNLIPTKAHRHDHFFTRENLYAIDCRRDLGATLGARTRPFYLSKAIWYAFAGCQPTFAPGKRDNAQWALTIGNPYFEKEALRVLVASAAHPDDALGVVCPRDARAADVVCRYATRHGGCHDLGTRLTECELTPAQQAEAAR